jgi:hypothetical protein
LPKIGQFGFEFSRVALRRLGRAVQTGIPVRFIGFLARLFCPGRQRRDSLVQRDRRLEDVVHGF